MGQPDDLDIDGDVVEGPQGDPGEWHAEPTDMPPGRTPGSDHSVIDQDPK